MATAEADQVDPKERIKFGKEIGIFVLSFLEIVVLFCFWSTQKNGSRAGMSVTLAQKTQREPYTHILC